MKTSQRHVFYLLNSLMDNIITVRRHKSQKFNFSLHVKIKRIESEDKFLIKTHEIVKSFCQKTAKRII